MDVCYDGDEAWDYLSTTEYDVAVLDIMMPGRDGVSLVPRDARGRQRRAGIAAGPRATPSPTASRA